MINVSKIIKRKSNKEAKQYAKEGATKSIKQAEQ